MINGRYEVLELLGRGGNGQVWLSFDRVLRERVALKIVIPINTLIIIYYRPKKRKHILRKEKYYKASVNLRTNVSKLCK
jgi:serine/threonine protein kinase